MGFFRAVSLLSLTLMGGGVLGACSDETGVVRASVELDAESPFDFGDVQVGLIARRELTVTNHGSSAVKITGIVPAADFENGTRIFGARSEPFTLAPSQSQTITVTFQALVATEAPERTSLRILTDVKRADSDQSYELTVELTGRGVRSGLIVEPDPVDFGRVLAGSSRVLAVTLTNGLATPIEVRSLLSSRGVPRIESLGGSGRFAVLGAAEGEGGLLGTGLRLEAGGSATVQLEYTPDARSPGRTDQARWAVATCDDPLCERWIDLIGRGTDSAIECAPATIDFGTVVPGRTRTATVTCTNVASGEIDLTGWRLDPASAPELMVAPYAGVPSLVGPGESFTTAVTFAPTLATFQSGVMPSGVLVITSEGVEGQVLQPVRIPLSGNAGGATLSVLPAMLAFGQVVIDTTYTKRLLLSNDGVTPLEITRITADTAMTGAYYVLTSTMTLAPGASRTLDVSFVPNVPGVIGSVLRIESNDVDRPVIDVPLDGEGLDLPPCDYVITPLELGFGTVLRTQSRELAFQIENVGTDLCLVNGLSLPQPPLVPAHDFVLVNGDEDGVFIMPGASHAVPVRLAPQRGGAQSVELEFYVSNLTNPNPTVTMTGVGGALTEVTCPAPQVTQSGTPVTLTATGMSLGGTIVDYEWAVVSGPAGGIGTPDQWTPDPPDTQTVTFLPHIIGVYDLTATAIASTGERATCTTRVTAEGLGLRVTLTWDGTGDVDLHLHDGTPTAPWFSPNDCYYSNRTPQWVMTSPPALGPNPELDFDNTSSFGPENTRIDAVVIGQPYTIGVHNFSAAAGRIATVQVFCGGVTAPTRTFVSAPLSGTDGGNCSSNDFWKVATVQFISTSSCAIAPLNTTVQSSAACAAY